MSKPRNISLFLSATLLLSACDSQESNEHDEASSEAAVAEATEESSPSDETSETEEIVDGHAENPELPDNMEPNTTNHFGAAFTIDEEPTPLAALLATAEEHENYKTEEPVLVSAEIEQVCQSKGCWFTLTTDQVDIPVRVRMLDYGFFVPRNTAGASVTVEGTFEKTTLTQEMAQHFADDAAKVSGEEPAQIDGPQENYEFTASGIEITLPAS